MKYQLAARCAGVDFLGERPKMYAPLMEVIEHADEVAQAAGQAVEFPDNQRVAVLQCLEATEQRLSPMSNCTDGIAKDDRAAAAGGR